MQIKEKISINITFVNSKAKEVKSFLESHSYTYPKVFLRGIEGLLCDEGISEGLKNKAKNLVK